MERKLVPYVSIDIETTGISDRSHILQISAVFDDLVSPIGKLKTIDLPIMHKTLTHCEPYAMGMNAELLKKMMDKKFETFSPESAARKLNEFLVECRDTLPMDWTGQVRQRVVFAGKNVTSFDIPKLKSFMIQPDGEALKRFESNVHYKTLDVGSLYFDVFGENVSLSEINKLTGRKEVSHNALDDAFDVVHAVRHKLGIK